jgi:tetratricopeptide (TPR) repeat protein
MAAAAAPAAAGPTPTEAKEARTGALKERGNALAEAGDMAGALRVFEEAISLLGPSTSAKGAGGSGRPSDEPSAVLWELKSQCHMQLEEWLEAVQAAERAVELSGEQWPDARHTLGRSLLQFGEVRAAVRVLTELYGAHPANEEVREDLIEANAILLELRRREEDFDLQMSGRAGLDAQELEVCRCKRNLLERGKAVDSDCTLGMDEEEEAASARDRARREAGVGMEDDDDDDEGEEKQG